MEKGPYELSYPVGTVNWNGKFVEKLPAEAFVPTCRTLKSLGIDRLMITGYVQKLWAIGYGHTVNFESSGRLNLPEKEGCEAAIRFWRACEFLAEQKLPKSSEK